MEYGVDKGKLLRFMYVRLTHPGIKLCYLPYNPFFRYLENGPLVATTHPPQHHPRSRLWRLIGIAVGGADLSHGLIENLCQLAAVNPLEIDPDPLQLEAPPVARTRRAQQDVMDYAQAVARVKKSPAFKNADDGRTPMFLVLLQGRTI